MTISQQIITSLKRGYHVVVKNKDGDYEVFSPFKDGHGSYRTSGLYPSIEKAKQYIGYFDYYSPSFLDRCSKEENWQIVETFINLPEEIYPVGSKVRVRKDAKEILKKMGFGWGAYEDGMVGNVYEVENADMEAVKIDGYPLPLAAVEPVYDENRETIKIGSHTYDKAEVEERLEGLEEIN